MYTNMPNSLIIIIIFKILLLLLSSSCYLFIVVGCHSIDRPYTVILIPRPSRPDFIPSA